MKSTASSCLALVGLLTVGSAQADSSNAFRSITQLSAAQEVGNDPADQTNPVVSDGTARAVIRFDKGFSEARIRVRFAGLVGHLVTRLHLHCDRAGLNGPVAIGLIDTLNVANDNSDVIAAEGNRFRGTLTNADFPAAEGRDNGCEAEIGQPINNLASLAAAIDAGLVYWNLHTDAFGAGELRGQVLPLGTAGGSDD